jgi:hypothetical protein
MELSKELTKIITLGDDAFFVAKLDEVPKKGEYLVELVIRAPEGEPGPAAGCGVYGRCGRFRVGAE